MMQNRYLHNQQSSTSLISDGSMRQPLPNLVPQRTNVLTGASTKYYAQNSQVWNNTYQSLLKYQQNDKASI
jgi:hypothetical protein